VSVVTEPIPVANNTKLPAIIILNAGLLHRVGPNRLHVKIARKLANVGFTVLRFDFSGNGDSNARDDNIPFEQSAIDETQDAMDYLTYDKHIDKFILVGICSGADVAIRMVCCDNRVIGAIGINGFYLDGNISKELHADIARSTKSRYYHKHLFNYKSWWRLITGKSGFRNIIMFLTAKAKGLFAKNGQLLQRTHFSIIAQLLTRCNANLLLVYSEGSPALDTFQLVHRKEIDTLASSKKLSIKIVKHCDHVFTLLESQNTLMDLIYKWTANKQRS